MGVALAAVGLLLCLIIPFAFFAMEEADISFKRPESKRLKKKNKQLETEIVELRSIIELLDKKNVVLTNELIARRNGLPWVNVEELDGPQE